MRYVSAIIFSIAAAPPALAQDMDRAATAVFAAAADGNITLLREYLDAGYDVNYQRKGDTALSNAVVFKRTEAVRFLLERGANPAMMTYDEYVVGFQTPRPLIEYARKSSSREIVALLEARLGNAAAAPAVAQAPSAPRASVIPTGRASARWAPPASFAAGQAVLISTSGGLEWRPGTVIEVGTGEDERQYLVRDGNNQNHWLDWPRVTATTRQPYWTQYFVGDWKLHTGMSSVLRTDGRDVYRLTEGGMKLPPLRINADGSYFWRTSDGKSLRGRWTARADKPGIVLAQGEKGLDWTLYNSTSKSSIDASRADEVRLVNPAVMGSVGSRIGNR